MPTQPIDRRVQRTRQLLSEALIELILEKGYDDITIQDILDRANLGRSTFYAHYRDKEDLLMSGFHALFEGFQENVRASAALSADPLQAGKELSLFFFRHAGTHQGLFRAMIGQQGGKIIVENSQKYLAHLIQDHIETELPGQNPDFPADLVAHFIASSYLSLLTWWLDHDMPHSPERMDELFQQMVFPGIRAVLEG